jgi:hypothetical protein
MRAAFSSALSRTPHARARPAAQTTPHKGQVALQRREFEWYRYARWVLLSIVGFLISGTVVFFISFWLYICIRVPDQGLEPDGIIPWAGYLGIYGYLYIVQLILLIGILFFMFLMGFAQNRVMELEPAEGQYELRRRQRYHEGRCFGFDAPEEEPKAATADEATTVAAAEEEAAAAAGDAR